MLRNYLKVALRNLGKEKLYTSVNVFGLSVAVAACLLIALFVRHEWSYDRFHEDSDRIFRAWGREDWGEGREFFYTLTPYPLAEALETTIPEVENTVRVRAMSALVGSPEERFNESVRVVDTSFFEVFDFQLATGRFTSNPNSVVITPSLAKKYFGDASAVGKTLPIQMTDRPEDFIVTGIVEEPPQASSIQFDMVIPSTKLPDLISEGARRNWFSIGFETYVLLDQGASKEAVEAKFPAMMTQVLGDEAEESGYELGLQSITDIHLNVDYPVGIEPTSNPVYGYFLVGVALLVLVVASINFVTLSIGQSARRTTEVGIRKAIGAGRLDLMRQFWGEAFLIVVVSVAAGIVLSRFALPIFKDLSSAQLTFALDGAFALFIVTLTIVIAAFAGIYPALVLSRFGPADILRGRTKIRGDRSLTRRGLVVVQFSISILMIIATLFVVRQLDYVQETDLGFEKEQVVVLRTGFPGEEAETVFQRLDAELSDVSLVKSMAYSAFPMNDAWGRFGFEADDGSYAEFMANLVSPEFVDVMDIELIAGRGFSRERSADSTALIVNEAFVREFGFESAETALGRGLPATSFGPHQIIGVVRDFNYESLHSAVRPLALAQTGEWLFRGADDINIPTSTQRDISLRIAPGTAHGTVDVLKNAWTTVAPDQPFEFYFLDEAIDAQYRQEVRLGQIVGTAALLALVIACLGLFSLAALTVVRRRKEIGVRKVLGATVSNIVVLLARDFALLVGVAFLLSAPAAYILVTQWLDNFAYRVDVGPLTFIVAGLLAMLLAIATVSYQSVRAATSDPVNSLRYE